MLSVLKEASEKDGDNVFSRGRWDKARGDGLN